LNVYIFTAVNTNLILIAALTAALTGCAATPNEGVFMTTPKARMSIEDLGMYRLDCNRADEQFEFLNYHLSSKKERISNGLMMTSVFGWFSTYRDGTWPDQWALKEGRYDNTARILIAQLKERCQPGMPYAAKVQPQGCLHLDESMPSGASSGSQCVQKPTGRKQQKITRWEATVDN
jgi:hypothetical protein